MYIKLLDYINNFNLITAQTQKSLVVQSWTHCYLTKANNLSKVKKVFLSLYKSRQAVLHNLIYNIIFINSTNSRKKKRTWDDYQCGREFQAQWSLWRRAVDHDSLHILLQYWSPSSRCWFLTTQCPDTSACGLWGEKHHIKVNMFTCKELSHQQQ